MVLSIRQAFGDEIDTLVAMSRAMSDESPNYRDETFSEEKAKRVIDYIIKAGTGFVAVDDHQIVGMIGGFVVSAPMHDYSYITDMGLYVKPSHRGSSAAARLVHKFEDMAILKKVDKVCLGISTGVHAEVTKRMYERMGYGLMSYGMVKNV